MPLEKEYYNRNINFSLDLEYLHTVAGILESLGQGISRILLMVQEDQPITLSNGPAHLGDFSTRMAGPHVTTWDIDRLAYLG